MAAQAAEFVRAEVSVILATNTQTAIAAHRATQTVPIVIVVVGDPVGARLADSLARPGGNVTATTSLAGIAHRSRAGHQSQRRDVQSGQSAACRRAVAASCE
jgi:ABC-type uncharacterized transport system substrate-binding protein